MSPLVARRENYRSGIALKRAPVYLWGVANVRYPFTPQVVMYAPAAPGTYTLWDRDVLLFIGEAPAPQTILERLMDHYCGRARPSQATHCAWEVVELCAVVD